MYKISEASAFLRFLQQTLSHLHGDSQKQCLQLTCREYGFLLHILLGYLRKSSISLVSQSPAMRICLSSNALMFQPCQSSFLSLHSTQKLEWFVVSANVTTEINNYLNMESATLCYTDYQAMVALFSSGFTEILRNQFHLIYIHYIPVSAICLERKQGNT